MSVLPPTYTQQENVIDAVVGDSDGSATDQETQILIVPLHDSLQFQKGYLGAPGERAAIEGELHIKGARESVWNTVTMSLRSVETAESQELELAFTDAVLFSYSSSESSSALPSTIPFSIPLTPDTPQCIHMPQSSLVHTLTATLHPTDPSSNPLSRTLIFHTRRYTSHSPVLQLSPQMQTLDDPTQIEVQIPRSTFRVGEPIPIYVTIPPPERTVVVEHGLRLRNVKAELVRVVKYPSTGPDDEVDWRFDDDSEEHEFNEADILQGESSSSTVEKSSLPTTLSSVSASNSRSTVASIRTVTSRSGASCRFHLSRPIRLRLVLHQHSPTASPSLDPSTSGDGEQDRLDYGSECTSITQTTVLHSVSFYLRVDITFLHSSTHTERTSSFSFGITLLPPPAPLPEVEEGIHAAYHKKHDRPPAKTVRYDESDTYHPHVDEREPGPSALPSGAPPPFEELDAPPPFSPSQPTASTSSRLPTFVESESEVYMLSAVDDVSFPPPASDFAIAGEGTLFGFAPSEQFDGHSDDLERSSTPPPTMEMARDDANVTDLAQLVNQPERAVEMLGRALEQEEEGTTTGSEPAPPPPPPMDDPSDPPPSIDSDFRSHGVGQDSGHVPPQGHTSDQPLSHTPVQSPVVSANTHVQVAPPPYLVPGSEEGNEHVTGPPPYVDLVHSSTDNECS